MIYVDFVKENIKEHNLNLSQIPDNLYRILIIEGSGSAKINSLFNLINQFFYYAILFSCAKIYWTQFYVLFCYENFK